MRHCMRCGVEAPPEANFCMRCGASLAQGGADAAGPGALGAAVAPPPPTPRPPLEAAIFIGRSRMLGSLWEFAPAAALLPAGSYIWYASGQVRWFLYGLGLLALYHACRWLWCATTRYTVTTHRVVLETGIFSRRRDFVWLYRVRDLSLRRPFSKRAMFTGDLEIQRFEPGVPPLAIREIRGASHVYDQLRVAVERQVRQNLGTLCALNAAPPALGWPETASAGTPSPVRVALGGGGGAGAVTARAPRPAGVSATS